MPPLSSLAAPPDSLQSRRESHRLSSSNASLGPQMLSYATEAGPTACVSGMNHSEIPLSLFLNGAHFGMEAGKRWEDVDGRCRAAMSPVSLFFFFPSLGARFTLLLTSYELVIFDQMFSGQFIRSLTFTWMISHENPAFPSDTHQGALHLSLHIINLYCVSGHPSSFPVTS